MIETELAWAAGAFEGEGCVTRRPGKDRTYIRLAITQNGGPEAVAFLQRFCDAVGRGHVLGPYDYSANGLGTKPRYVVAIEGQDDAHAVMESMSAYMTPGNPKTAKYEQLAEAQRSERGERTS